MDEKREKLVQNLSALIEAAKVAERAVNKIYDADFEYFKIRVCPPDGHGVLAEYDCSPPIAHEYAEVAHGNLIERCEELHNELIETA
jgi:hypothetical protein